jgi:hypothetical protein
MSMTDYEKQLIRAYMIRAVIPSAIGLSIISAIFGFVVNDWARGEAYAKAYSDAMKSVITLTEEATKSAEQVQNLLKETKSRSDEIITLDDDARRTHEQVSTEVKGDLKQIATYLLADNNFKDSLAKVDQEQFSSLVVTVSDLRANLLKASPDVRNINDRIVRCPDGYYLIGFSFQDQAGLAHGALWGPSAICGRLNVGQLP